MPAAAQEVQLCAGDAWRDLEAARGKQREGRMYMYMYSCTLYMCMHISILYVGMHVLFTVCVLYVLPPLKPI